MVCAFVYLCEHRCAFAAIHIQRQVSGYCECRAAFKASLHRPYDHGQVASEAGDLIFNAFSASSSGTLFETPL